MCDSNFVNNYDNYYANVAYQATEQTHNDSTAVDEGYLTAPMHFYNQLPDDLPPSTHQQQQNMLMLPPHLLQPQHPQLPFAQQRTTTAPQEQGAASFSGSTMHRTGQPLKIVSSVRGATAAPPNPIPGNSASSIYGNIPFVQIHTTDARPQKSNFGNVFRRSASNQEIKSEPIKSESSELAKESTNATPTPPAQKESCISDDGDLAPASTQMATNDFSGEAAVDTTNEVTTDMDVASSSQSHVPMLSIHKCSQCTFFSLSMAGLTAHTAVVHQKGVFCGGLNSGVRIPCPGCDNVFYAYNSLETHLREDHLTFSEDCVKLMEVVKKSYKNSMGNTNPELAANTAEKKTPKVRIRNVAYLRDRRPPNIRQDSEIDERLYQITACENESALNERQEPDLISMLTEQNDEEFGNNISNLNISETPSSIQKISLVNTNALREPARVRQEYETMSNLSSFLSNCSDVNVHVANDIEDTSNNQSVGLQASDNNLNHFDERPPKIFIRNVGLLQEQGNLNVAPNINSNAMNYNFMTPAIPQVGNGNYLTNGDDFDSNVQIYDAGRSQMALGNISDQYIFDSGASGSYMSALERCEGFPTYGNQQHDISYTMFESQLNDSLQHSVHPSNTPIITEPTPPPIPTSHAASQLQTYVQSASLDQKPFIRNVNIFRPPESRGTLHLRTVDELNLMNKNEVQNLIAPNLDNTLNSINNPNSEHNREDFTMLTDNSKLFESESEGALEELSPWLDLDCIITDVISPLNCNFSLPSEDSPKDLLHLETPQVSVNSTRDTEEVARGQPFNKPLPPPSAQEHQHHQPVSIQIKELPPEEILAPCSPSNNKHAGGISGTSKDANLSAPKMKAPTEVVASRVTPTSSQKTVSMPPPKGTMPIKRDVEAPQIIPISSLSSLLNYSNVPPLVPSSCTAKSPSVCFVTPSITITPISTPKPKEPSTSTTSTLPVPPLVYPLKTLVSQKVANAERRALVSTESLTVTSHNVSVAKQKPCAESQILVSPELRTLLTTPKLPPSTSATVVRNPCSTTTTSCSQMVAERNSGNSISSNPPSQFSITLNQKSAVKRKCDAPADVQPNALPPERRTPFSVSGLSMSNLVFPAKRRNTSVGQMSILPSNRPLTSSGNVTVTSHQQPTTMTSIVPLSTPKLRFASAPVNQIITVERRPLIGPVSAGVTSQHPLRVVTAASGITPAKQVRPCEATAVKKTPPGSGAYQMGGIVVTPQESLLTEPKNATAQLLPVKPKEGNLIQVKEISTLTENVSRRSAPPNRKRAPARKPNAPAVVPTQISAISTDMATTTTQMQAHKMVFTARAAKIPATSVSQTIKPIETTAPTAAPIPKNAKAVAAQTILPQLRLRTFSNMAPVTAQPQLSPAEGATAAAAPTPAPPEQALRTHAKNLPASKGHVQVSGSVGKILPTTATSKKATQSVPATLPMTRSHIPTKLPKSTLTTKGKQAAETPSDNAASPVDAVVPLRGGRSVRGRLFGKVRKMAAARRNRYLAKKMAKSNQRKFKCPVKKCTFRFNELDTLKYHKKCHASTTDRNAKQCPECQTSAFKNWNTLHTHLWHMHKIDMELYSCGRCKYKTPNFSRLVNIHAPAHLDNRPFKCRECKNRYFKTAKQLWAHGCWHREMRKRNGHAQTHRCAKCGAVFSRIKTLREHSCNLPEEHVQCPLCDRKLSSKASLLLHTRIHGEKTRYECLTCGYKCSDHNAMRRHKETHNKKNVYQCRFCQYKSVQSTAYQRHVKSKHAEKAEEVLFLCKIPQCAFSTINEKLLSRHMLSKHQTDAPAQAGEAENFTISMEQSNLTDSNFSTVAVDGDITEPENSMNAADSMLTMPTAAPAEMPTAATATQPAVPNKPKRGRPRKNTATPVNVPAVQRVSSRGRKFTYKKLNQNI